MSMEVMDVPDTETELKPKVYLCGPVKNDYSGGQVWRREVMRQYPDMFEWVNPLDYFDGENSGATIVFSQEEADRHHDGMETYFPSDIVPTDKQLIRESDAVLVGYLEEVVSPGTWQEELYAHQLGKPIALWHGGSRYAWSYHHSHLQSESLDECVDYLQKQLEWLGP